MEFNDNILVLESFLTVTLAILVLFLGKGLNLRFPLLRELNIPEPVVGGLIVAILLAFVHSFAGITVELDMSMRDSMLIYFFTTIGLSANIQDIIKGGKPFFILLIATLIFMVLQNVVGISVSSLLGLEPAVGLMGGSVALIGGHGTAIAWAPTFSQDFGIKSAMEIGIACATFGLIIASVAGGPIASYLIKKHDLKSEESGDTIVGVMHDEKSVKMDHFSFLHAIVAIHVGIVIGYFLNAALEEAGVKMPLFVTALFAGILLSSFITPNMSKKVKWMDWRARGNSVSLIADISLGIFLAMSLMSMQLWVIADLGGPIILIVGVQFIFILFIAVFVIFRLMGKNYDAAVMTSGFIGAGIGSTATAMANMTAVTKRYGPSHLAFLLVPLVFAFFINLTNAILIQVILMYL